MKDSRSRVLLRWTKRVAVYLIGLFFMAMGVVFSARSGLGVSPVGSLANVLYQVCLSKGIVFLTLGNATIVVYLGYIVAELLMLRKDFRPAMFLQIFASVLFGWLVSLATAVLGILPEPGSYAVRMLYLLCSVPLVAFGVMLYLSPNILPTPGEGMSLSIAKLTGKQVSTGKTIFDCSMVVISCAVSFACFGGLVGVREGTVICALLVGPVLRRFQRLLQTPLMKFVEREGKLDRAIQAAAGDYLLDKNGNPKIIIAIGREFGAGGYEIGQKLAKKLGIPFYDKEIDEMASADSGIPMEKVAELEAHMDHELVYDLKNSAYAMYNQELDDDSFKKVLPLQERLFVAQTAAIRKLAARNESCVIMGHCADYILYNDKNCFRIFVHALPLARIDRVKNLYDVTEEEALAQINATDTCRARHYRHFTGRNYGSQQYYHLSMDSSQLGTDGSVDVTIKSLRLWCDVRGTHPLSTLLENKTV